MAEADQNNDGKLTFPEFMVFVKYAHQTLNSKSKPKTNKIQVQGRDSKALSQETENMRDSKGLSSDVLAERKRIAEESEREKAKNAKDQAAANKEYEARIASQVGRDAKQTG